MSGTSKRTKVIAFRMPVAVYAILDRRVKGKRSRHKTVNEYVRDRMVYDILRKH